MAAFPVLALEKNLRPGRALRLHLPGAQLVKKPCQTSMKKWLLTRSLEEPESFLYIEKLELKTWLLLAPHKSN